jgi:hypothetical protein
VAQQGTTRPVSADQATGSSSWRTATISRQDLLLLLLLPFFC